MHPADITSELNALTDDFFKAVSFQSGQRPGYARIRDLFIDDGKLIKNNSQAPEIASVEEFIGSRQILADSGALTSFKEVETAHITERFGNIAHRLSTYKKRGTMYRQAIDGSGVISTQFIRTPTGWKITSMVWDDERPGLAKARTPRRDRRCRPRRPEGVPRWPDRRLLQAPRDPAGATELECPATWSSHKPNVASHAARCRRPTVRATRVVQHGHLRQHEGRT